MYFFNLSPSGFFCIRIIGCGVDGIALFTDWEVPPCWGLLCAGLREGGVVVQGEEFLLAGRPRPRLMFKVNGVRGAWGLPLVAVAMAWRVDARPSYWAGNNRTLVVTCDLITWYDISQHGCFFLIFYMYLGTTQMKHIQYKIFGRALWLHCMSGCKYFFEKKIDTYFLPIFYWNC